MDIEEGRDEYVAAAVGSIQSAEPLIARLRAEAPGAAVELYRIFRTLRGIAGFLASPPIHCVSARAETALRSVAAGGLRVTPERAAILERAIGLLRRRILEDPRGSETPAEEALVGDLEAWLDEDLSGAADESEGGQYGGDPA